MKLVILKSIFLFSLIFLFSKNTNAQINDSPISDLWTSNDGTRSVKVMVGSGDAFLFNNSNGNSLKPIFLMTNVKAASFTGSGSSLKIVLNLKGGSIQTFEADGSVLNPTAQRLEPTSDSYPISDKGKNKKSGKIFIQIQGGASAPLSSDFVSNLNVGVDGELMMGCYVNDGITLGLLIGYYNYNYQHDYPDYNSPVSFFPLEVVSQIYIGKNKLKPYFIIGGGIGVYTYAISNRDYNSITYGDFLIDPGFGLSYEISKNLNLFLQSKLTIDLGNLSYLPQDLFLPVQVGCNFSL